jgi:hypothetical protein
VRGGLLLVDSRSKAKAEAAWHDFGKALVAVVSTKSWPAYKASLVE